MSENKDISPDLAKSIGDQIGVDWEKYDLEEFRRGIDVEFEHGSHDPQTDVTHDDPLLTGKIALAHLKEFPDYYTRLEKMEAEAEEYWTSCESGVRAAPNPRFCRDGRVGADPL